MDTPFQQECDFLNLLFPSVYGFSLFKFSTGKLQTFQHRAYFLFPNALK